MKLKSQKLGFRKTLPLKRARQPKRLKLPTVIEEECEVPHPSGAALRELSEDRSRDTQKRRGRIRLCSCLEYIRYEDDEDGGSNFSVTQESLSCGEVDRDEEYEQILAIRDHVNRDRNRLSRVPDTVSIAEDQALESLCHDCDYEPDKPADLLSKKARKQMVRKMSIQLLQNRASTVSTLSAATLFNNREDLRQNISNYWTDQLGRVPGEAGASARNLDDDSDNWGQQNDRPSRSSVASKMALGRATADNTRKQSAASVIDVDNYRLEQFRSRVFENIRRGSVCPDTVNPSATGANLGISQGTSANTSVTSMGLKVGGNSRVSLGRDSVGRYSNSSMSRNKDGTLRISGLQAEPKLSKIAQSTASLGDVISDNDIGVNKGRVSQGRQTLIAAPQLDESAIAAGSSATGSGRIEWTTDLSVKEPSSVGMYNVSGTNSWDSEGSSFATDESKIQHRARTGSVFDDADILALRTKQESLMERRQSIRRQSISQMQSTEAPKMTTSGKSQYPLPGSRISTIAGGTYNTTKAANNLISQDEIAYEIEKALETLENEKSMKFV